MSAGHQIFATWPAERLAARAGGTPLFAYSRRLVDERIAELRAALPDGIELRYAVKANPMPALVQHLSRCVDGFDIASGGELRAVLDTPMPPERISFTGPGKSDAELSAAVAAGVTLTVESEAEIERVRKTAGQLALVARVAVRVNPDFAIRGSGVRIGGGAQQFGIDAERVPDALAALRDPYLEFEGFHVFPGSQNVHAEPLIDAFGRTVDLMGDLTGHAPNSPRVVTIGGGFGIPYSARDTPLDLAAVGRALTELVEHRLRPRLPDTRVVLELGRYLVGEAGVYVTRIVDRKCSRGTTFLVVDGGMHHQLAVSGNLGQTVRRNYPMAVANRLGEPATETVTVVGCLCTPLDLLGSDVALPRADVGDLIAIYQAGAYGLSASPVGFLSHPAPVEMLI